MIRLFKVIKDFSLLTAGVILNMILVAYVDNQMIKNHSMWFLVILIVLLLLGFFNIFSRIHRLYVRISFWWNTYRKNYCVYAPFDIDSNTASWVDCSLQQIMTALRGTKHTFKIIRQEKDMGHYPLVINPYGGVYPEKDLSNLASFEKILTYVREGGTYVNIADIPFYYAYDHLLDRKIDTTPFVEGIQPIRAFISSLLTQRLHCLVYSTDVEGISRVMSISDTARNLFTRAPWKYDADPNYYSPQIAIPYGKGFFIFSTLHITPANVKSSMNYLLQKIGTL